jgi:hypothetical protein
VIILIALLLGCAVGAIVMLVFSLCVMAATRRQVERRMGYLDFTSTRLKGGTASANPNDGELSEGGQSQPPSHLRLVKGEKNG